MLRQASAAGRYYPASKEKIRSVITPMEVKGIAKERYLGAVMPHAGYPYSGGVAMAVGSRLDLPEIAIILGPSHTGIGAEYAIMASGIWQTPMGEVEIDSPLAHSIMKYCRHIKADPSAHQYEHSIEVQIPILQYFKPDIKIVPITVSFGKSETLADIGYGIASALRETGREAIIIASSDMTHYESQSDAHLKDSLALDAIIKLDAAEMLERIQANHITMCGYAPVAAMLTAVKELGAKRARVVAYQTSGDITHHLDQVVGYAGLVIEQTEESAQVALARAAVEAFVKEKKVITPSVELAAELSGEAGVFVSLKKLGELRGCIGTFEAHFDNIADEIVSNAVSSAARDPRFEPVAEWELPLLSYSVDVLTPPQPVEDTNSLDAKKYGVIVESGHLRGLLLPDLEGVDTPSEQISICRQKAGITADAPVKLYRFEVKRYH
ncbi:AMMECR1 domain-containing protein [Dehalococcoides mccartyi]|uniref:AmmeMemoRadiSam system protein B n=1 Tax=Dehalococcoides mccartyi TaxID=61435 RepID=UPI00098FFC2E|nr:AmmeMemoRadiSam system protein B [Dehalococcoides mccartyi]AQU06300.1 AMMECR1 domain-containing protein [Dehalococcoides mccartyi]AQU07742.1 AMMECR1 domain-containing protein [Dehalococcoides mccartyi]